MVRDHSLDVGFEWIDGFLHAPLNDDVVRESVRLNEDATLARDLGFDAEYVDTVPLVNRPGIRFSGQARIHPRAYLAGIAKAFVALGGRIYEHSAADEFSDDPRGVKVNGSTVSFEDVIIATHNPLVGLAGLAGSTLFQTKLALYTTYMGLPVSWVAVQADRRSDRRAGRSAALQIGVTQGACDDGAKIPNVRRRQCRRRRISARLRTGSAWRDGVDAARLE